MPATCTEDTIAAAHQNTEPLSKAGAAMRFLRVLLALLAFAPCSGALAIDPERLEGWWGGADVGYMSMTRHLSITGDASQHKMITGLRAGYSWDPRLLVGVEASNWLLKGANMWHINEGEGIQTLNAIAQAYPFGRPLWLKAGIGGARFWTDVPEEGTGRGFGAVAGLGYDFALWGSFYLTTGLDFAWGRIKDATSPAGVKQDQSYRAYAFKIGLTFR